MLSGIYKGFVDSLLFAWALYSVGVIVTDSQQSLSVLALMKW